MSDNNIEKQNSVVDTYEEHSQHLVYRSDCSECYKQAPEVKLSEDGDIVLVEDEEKLESCGGCGVLCKHLYCEKCQKDIDDNPEM